MYITDTVFYEAVAYASSLRADGFNQEQVEQLVLEDYGRKVVARLRNAGCL